MNKCRILLADDHQTVREALRVLLNLQADLEVIGEAADGGAAVQRALQLAPDVVVLDLSMPGVGGLQAIRDLRRRCPSTHVLALTRHSAAGYLQQVLQFGAAGFVLKQSPAAELLEGIRTVARGGTYVDRAVTTYLLRDQARQPASAGQAPRGLSTREEEVLRLIANGYSNKETAARLRISVKTVDTHKANAMQKLGMSSRIDLVRLAHLEGWFEHDE